MGLSQVNTPAGTGRAEVRRRPWDDEKTDLRDLTDEHAPGSEDNRDRSGALPARVWAPAKGQASMG